MNETATTTPGEATSTPPTYPHDNVGVLLIVRKSGWCFTVEAKPSTIKRALDVAEKAHPSVFRDNLVSAQYGSFDSTGNFIADPLIPVDLVALGYTNRGKG